MEYRCEDLPQNGVVLVPPSSPEYGALLADIKTRLANPVPGSPPRPPNFEDPAGPTMIVCNRSQIGIAAVSWIWKFETETARTTSSSVLIAIGGGPSLLTPFGLDERARKICAYWHVILPGSKRGIRGNRMFGDNTDVRPPQGDELWTGGGVGFGGGDRRTRDPIKSITLAVDGVFFVDGGFAGPDTLRNFDRVTADADAHVQVGRIAQEGHNEGLSPAEIFARIEAVTGPDRGRAKLRPTHSGPPEDFPTDSLRNIASQIGMARKHSGDGAQFILLLRSWAGATLPNYRKL